MIGINLIPASLRKSGTRKASSLVINIPQEVLLGVGAGLIFLLVTVHLILGVIWFADMGRLSGGQVNWQKVLPDKTILDAIYKESGALRKKIDLISDMTTKRSIFWSTKFNAISDSLPRGVWIRILRLRTFSEIATISDTVTPATSR